jgi:hypothetical protein
MWKLLKRTLIGVVKFVVMPVVAFVALNVAWLAIISFAYDRKIGWIISPVHYRLSFSIEEDGRVYSGDTVVQVEYRRIPSWQVDMPLYGIYFPNGGASSNGGPAASVELPNGKAVSLLPDGRALYLTHLDVRAFGGQRRYTVLEIANRLLTKDPNVKFATASDPNFRVITAETAPFVSGRADIPLELMPPMAVLTDADDPQSVHVFDPTDPQQWLGPGAKFLGARIEVTHDPLSSNTEGILPWLLLRG